MDSNSTVDNASVFLSSEEALQLAEQFQINQDMLERDRLTFERKIEEMQEKFSQLTSQKSKLENDLKEFQTKIDLYVPQISEQIQKQKGHYKKDPKIVVMYKRFRDLELRTPSKKLDNKAIKSLPFLSFKEVNEALEKSPEEQKEEQMIKEIEKIMQTDSGLTQQQKTMLKQTLEMYRTESETYEANQSKLDSLVRSSFENREHVLHKEAKLLAIQYCVHCKQRFSPLANEDGDCVFHVGKLKFYSCKSCGCDEYYNCCGKCLKCSKGCGKGKHAAKEKVYRHDSSPFTQPKTQSLKEIGDQSFYDLTMESINFSTFKV